MSNSPYRESTVAGGLKDVPLQLATMQIVT